MRVAHARIGPSNGSAAAIVCSGVPERGPLLGQHDELRAGGGGRAGEAVGGFEIAIPVRGRLQLNGGGTHEVLLPQRTDPSVNPRREHIVCTTCLYASRGAGWARSDRTLMLCVATARVGVLRRSWWAVWDGDERCTRGERARRWRALGRCERGTPIEVTTGAGVDAQDAAAGDGRRARAHASTRRACSTSRAGRHARRTSWLWSAGAGVAASARRRRLEPRRGHARRAP